MLHRQPRLTLRLALTLALLGALACGDDDRRGRDADLEDGTLEDGTLEDASGDMSVPLPSAMRDPSCVDGQYTETFPDISADLSDVFGAYPTELNEDQAVDFIRDVLAVRYPVGLHISSEAHVRNWVQRIGINSQPSAISALSTVVHESGHELDISLPDHTYVFTDTLQLRGQNGDSTDRFGQTIARNLINGDAYARPDCDDTDDSDCEFYRNTYLNADPNNGGQGFNMLVEEMVQYINSLATAWAYLDQAPPLQSTSARDGVLTFLWYSMRYLHLCRLEHPDAYAFISGSAEWREIILTFWGRAWLYLDATEGITQLSIDEALLQSRVNTPELLDEINRIRLAHGCEGV